MKVRTRFAPSPTGFLHIGGIRQALYCYALARRHDGQFILRLEDTDRTRLVEGAVEEIMSSLEDYGLTPDEGSKYGGDFGPYLQSERLEIYQKYADELIEKGDAYYCFLTGDEASELKEIAKANGVPFRSPHRDLDLTEAKTRVQAGESYVIRHKIPKDVEIEGVDPLQGNVSINSNDVEDWVMIKSDGFPTYNYAVVIDDHLMEITHLFRGAEFISSFPKNILLYRSLGWEAPLFFHLPLILDPDGGKLSKRKGAVSAAEFLKEGYLPEAILNFLMLLGWSSPEERKFGESENEIFSLEEFTELFAVEDMNKSNPVFDRTKLIWFNQQYIQNMDIKLLAEAFKRWLGEYAESDDLVDEIINDSELHAKMQLVNTRSKLLPDMLEGIRFFYSAPSGVDWEIKQLNRVNEAGKLADLKQGIKEIIESLDDDAGSWTHEQWEQPMRDLADKHELKHGDVFMVLRLAVCGSPFSPPLFESLQVLGKDEVIARLER